MRGLWLGLLCVAPVATPDAAAPVTAMAASSEQAVRATVSRWYEELAKKDGGRVWDIVAPGFIDASPHYEHIDNGSAALGPRVFTSLAATALRFRYEIDAIRIDANFARVQVWERGYFYAWAAQQTYERAAATTFVLERQEKDGRWLILAHQSSSQGVPPTKITDPMPDLRELFYGTEGKDRDPAKDAEAARNF
ncbi:MAG: hypothetical protein ACAH11_04050 [Sphingomonas sp.]